MTMRTSPLLAVIVTLVLAGCGGSSPGGPGGGGGGGPDGGSPRAADLRITAVTVHGGLPQAQAITVRGVVDQDGAVDRGYRVAFALGGSGPAALPADDGVAWSAEFPVAAGDGRRLDTVTVSVER